MKQARIVVTVHITGHLRAESPPRRLVCYKRDSNPGTNDAVLKLDSARINSYICRGINGLAFAAVIWRPEVVVGLEHVVRYEILFPVILLNSLHSGPFWFP